MDVSGARFKIRPYDPALPRRIEVTAGEQTRFMKQERGRADEIRTGDLAAVLAAPESRKAGAAKEQAAAGAAPSGQTSGEGTGTPPQSRGEERRARRAGLVVRIRSDAGTQATREDVRSGRLLLIGALPYLRKHRFGWKSTPDSLDRDLQPAVGIVTALSPLRLATPERTRQFELPAKVEVVNAVPVELGALKRGQSVTLRVEGGAAADGSVAAGLVVIGPAPQLGRDQIQGILEREEGRRPAAGSRRRADIRK
jgi:hypothetical protein